jgi:hypothetical protein
MERSRRPSIHDMVSANRRRDATSRARQRVALKIAATGQLIEAATGPICGPRRSNGELRDVFELQDHITAKVVSSVPPTIERAEIDRLKRKPTNTADSYDTFLRGVALHNLMKPVEARKGGDGKGP